MVWNNYLWCPEIYKREHLDFACSTMRERKTKARAILNTCHVLQRLEERATSTQRRAAEGVNKTVHNSGAHGLTTQSKVIFSREERPLTCEYTTLEDIWCPVSQTQQKHVFQNKDKCLTQSPTPSTRALAGRGRGALVSERMRCILHLLRRSYKQTGRLERNTCRYRAGDWPAVVFHLHVQRGCQRHVCWWRSASCCVINNF